MGSRGIDASPGLNVRLSGCVLALRDDPQTLAMYPFPFRFEIRYLVKDVTLEITFKVTNTGETVLPASMGAHPAFRWPFVPGLAKEAYALTFSIPRRQRRSAVWLTAC